jgi:sulfatase maturation enzyme AslB (radical SAM superfamily)
MPGGKFAPCCQWAGELFDTREHMVDHVGGAFLRGEIPKECAGCPPGPKQSWRSTFEPYQTDYQTSSIQFLDFRNNNLCNLKCRSCGPLFSTSWSAEVKREIINDYDSTTLDSIDLSQCKMVYFAGGEPLMNPQHYEVLKRLIDRQAQPTLMYSSNFTVTGYKDQNVADLWQHFDNICLHASIDAVGKYAEIVRSGTDWDTVETNLAWAKKLSNVDLKIAPVISAINIWWIDDLLKYFDWVEPANFQPVLADPDSIIGIGGIPTKYRAPLIAALDKSKFRDHVNMQRAIKILSEPPLTNHWYQFLTQQLVLDNYRKEHWFDNVPIKHNIYTESLQMESWVKSNWTKPHE